MDREAAIDLIREIKMGFAESILGMRDGDKEAIDEGTMRYEKASNQLLAALTPVIPDSPGKYLMSVEVEINIPDTRPIVTLSNKRGMSFMCTLIEHLDGAKFYKEGN